MTVAIGPGDWVRCIVTHPSCICGRTRPSPISAGNVYRIESLLNVPDIKECPVVWTLEGIQRRGCCWYGFNPRDFVPIKPQGEALIHELSRPLACEPVEMEPV